MSISRFRQDQFLIAISVSAVVVSTAYFIWTYFSSPVSSDTQSTLYPIIFLCLFGLALFSHIFIIWKIFRKHHNIKNTTNKLLKILFNSEECTVLTDTTGQIVEVIRNINSNRLLRNDKKETSGINIFKYLDINDEDTKEIIFQLLDGEPLTNRICTLIYEDSEHDVMVSASFLTDPENSFVFFIRDLDWFRKMQSELLHTERMAGIGRLAADIAHQLNTPLGSILLSSQVLLDENNNEDAHEDLEKIIRQTKRCKEVVKNLLDLSRKDEDESIDFMLKPLIERTVDLLLLRLRKNNIQVNLELDSKSIIHGKPADLEQALLNLVNNSIDAMSTGGKLSISTTTYREKQAIIYIKDSGKGINNRIQEKVFDPFFSTKEYGSGTGLGLAISRQIIENHGGSVEINSQPGRGTIVCVIIPLLMEKVS